MCRPTRSALQANRSAPSRRALPRVGCQVPTRILHKVDLPAADGPTMPRPVPGSTREAHAAQNRLRPAPAANRRPAHSSADRAASAGACPPARVAGARTARSGGRGHRAPRPGPSRRRSTARSARARARAGSKRRSCRPTSGRPAGRARRRRPGSGSGRACAGTWRSRPGSRCDRRPVSCRASASSFSADQRRMKSLPHAHGQDDVGVANRRLGPLHRADRALRRVLQRPARGRLVGDREREQSKRGADRDQPEQRVHQRDDGDERPAPRARRARR